jgi:hypothetical protein
MNKDKSLEVVRNPNEDLNMTFRKPYPQVYVIGLPKDNLSLY